MAIDALISVSALCGMLMCLYSSQTMCNNGKSVISPESAPVSLPEQRMLRK